MEAPRVNVITDGFGITSNLPAGKSKPICIESHPDSKVPITQENLQFIRLKLFTDSC